MPKSRLVINGQQIEFDPAAGIVIDYYAHHDEPLAFAVINMRKAEGCVPPVRIPGGLRMSVAEMMDDGRKDGGTPALILGQSSSPITALTTGRLAGGGDRP